MEEFWRKHGKSIGIGVGALALAYLVYRLSSDSQDKAHAVADFDKHSKDICDKKMPKIHRAVNWTDTRAKQKEQLNNWFDNAFKKFVKHHGAFSTNDDGCMKFDDFKEIYSVIEAYVRCDLVEGRCKVEQARAPLFKQAMVSDDKNLKELKELQTSYIDTVLQNLE